MAIKTFPLTMKWAHMITPNVRHLAFERTDGEALDFIPGQFITFHLEHEDKILRRSYSIATIPGKSNLIEIALSYFKGGTASEILFGLQPGQTLNAAGAYGRLTLRDDDPQRYVLIATGTGVTPYRAMLTELSQRLAQKPEMKVVLLLGVQSRAYGLYLDDFNEFAATHPQFEFQVFYSREEPEDPQPFEHLGYVQTGFAHLNLNPETDLIYLCGNPHMIDNAFDLMKDTGFSIQQVRREKYVS